uniref:Uncharacterized protein n=1 Tax=Tanacetum cinerariifolium TaxID=118510 RepID=A0A699HRQ0_TANCI|nr:hypothetical protein [Tanacetum cinerariifolium]
MSVLNATGNHFVVIQLSEENIAKWKVEHLFGKKRKKEQRVMCKMEANKIKKPSLSSSKETAALSGSSCT